MIAVLVVGAVAAHDDYRVVSTITQGDGLTQTKDGKMISMRTEEASLLTRDEKKVSAAELKTRLSVVVDARRDSLEGLVALEVRVVSSPIAVDSRIGDQKRTPTPART